MSEINFHASKQSVSRAAKVEEETFRRRRITIRNDPTTDRQPTSIHRVPYIFCGVARSLRSEPIRSAESESEAKSVKSPGPIGIRYISRVRFDFRERGGGGKSHGCYELTFSKWSASDPSDPYERSARVFRSREEFTSSVRLVMLGTWENRAQRMRHNFWMERN